MRGFSIEVFQLDNSTSFHSSVNAFINDPNNPNNRKSVKSVAVHRGLGGLELGDLEAASAYEVEVVSLAAFKGKRSVSFYVWRTHFTLFTVPSTMDGRVQLFYDQNRGI